MPFSLSHWSVRPTRAGTWSASVPCCIPVSATRKVLSKHLLPVPVQEGMNSKQAAGNRRLGGGCRLRKQPETAEACEGRATTLWVSQVWLNPSDTKSLKTDGCFNTFIVTDILYSTTSETLEYQHLIMTDSWLHRHWEWHKLTKKKLFSFLNKSLQLPSFTLKIELYL